MGIWVAGTINELFMKVSYTQINFSKKLKWFVAKLRSLR